MNNNNHIDDKSLKLSVNKGLVLLFLSQLFKMSCVWILF